MDSHENAVKQRISAELEYSIFSPDYQQMNQADLFSMSFDAKKNQMSSSRGAGLRLAGFRVVD